MTIFAIEETTFNTMTEMKNLLLPALLLLGISIMFVSCEKEGGGPVNTNNIEGRWWVPQQKSDYVFAGKPVHSFTDFNDFDYEEVFWYKAYLENGSCTLTDLQNGNTFTLPYNLIDNDLFVGQGIFQSYKLRIVNATKNEGAADIQFEYKTGTYVEEIERNGTIEHEGAIFKKVIADRYNGIDIYGISITITINGMTGTTQPSGPYWFINGKGEIMPCDRITLENGSVFWYDGYRIYFKAE